MNQWKKLPEPFDQQPLVIIVCATSGNGEAPDNCGKFFRMIKKVKNPKNMLTGVNYAVLALGGKHYFAELLWFFLTMWMLIACRSGMECR